MLRCLWMFVPPLMAVGTIVTLLQGIDPAAHAAPSQRLALNNWFGHCELPQNSARDTPSGCDETPPGATGVIDPATSVP